ncbi:MAG: MFS transporter [Bryobacteraceae bacterium]|nr:MFS transporter [Bryobacteraceae bacterium]
MTGLQISRICIAAIFALNGATVATWVSRIPAAQANLDASTGVLGLVLLATAAGALCSMPVTGWLISRHGSRPLVRFATLVLPVVLIPLAFARSPFELAAALFFFGAASGSQDVAMNVHAVSIEDELKRPVMGSFHAFWSAGAMTGSALGGLAAGLGLSVLTHFLIAAAGFLVIAFLASAGLHKAHQDAAPPSLSFRIPRPVAALGILAAVVSVAEGSVADWSALYLEKVIGAEAGRAALGFSAYSAAMIVTRLLVDRITAAFGSPAVVRAGALLAAAGLSLSLLTSSYAIAMAGFALVGLGVAGIVPNIFSATGRIRSLPSGVGMAAVTTMAFTGFLGGPPVIGGLAQALGLRLGLAFVVLCLLGVALNASAVAVEGGTAVEDGK